MMDQSTDAGIQPLVYNPPTNMINGDGTFGAAATGQTKMDLSAWDQSIVCSSCHPGGTFTEKDRNGDRYSSQVAIGRLMSGQYTPYNSYVFERYDQKTGAPQHTVEMAPWFYPMTWGGQPVTVPSMTNPQTGMPMGGWGVPMTFNLPDGTAFPMVQDQVVMPNVKEFDCLICHAEGYNNLMHSVMTYSGAHNASASFGANFMSMFTEAYNIGQGLVDTVGTAMDTPFGSGFKVVQYNASNLKGNPPSTSCQACHLPSKLKDIPDMFRDFLSSAPMKYTNSFKKSFTGLGFPAFDCNAPMGATWDWKAGGFAKSPYIMVTDPNTFAMMAFDATTGNPFSTTFSIMMPGNATNMWPSAYGVSEYNATLYASLPDNYKPAFVGGGNPAGSGPIYYESTITSGADYPGQQNQDSLKKSIVPFPRAEWFKRGDVWITEYDVHKFLECSGCHMDTGTSKLDGSSVANGKSQCDPGRGFDSASTIESSGPDSPTFTTASVNSQETVKMCDSCHVTGKTRTGDTTNTFGAPNVVASHTAKGFYANTVKAVKLVGGVETEFVGSHMDVLDCTVCHMYRKQMVVRSLDGTSGNRYPNMTGFQGMYGMMGMFTDGMPGMIPADTNEVEWKPLYIWQRFGNTSKANNADNWRRKLYVINYIDAILWNNEDPAYDANGDGVAGRAPSIHFPGQWYEDGAPTFNYDPYISRDMKAGMNFGPSGFAPIPVGFGGPTDGITNGAFMSAYNADGTFTGAWKYVGVYGGNVAFSTPDEISTYKAMRAANDPKWGSAKLTFSGANFKMTHGIRKAADFALGKSCADCHAPGANFFDGEFDMLGTAIEAKAGEKFMESPAVQMEVVGLKDDIATGAELHRKDGKLVELEFDEVGDYVNGEFTANPAGAYRKVMPIERGHAIYPEEKAYVGADGTTYATRQAWLDHLVAIAAPPVAAISSVSNSTLSGSTYNVPVNTAIVFTAADQHNSGFTYQWTFSDGVTVPAGLTANRTFSSVTVLTATLKVTSSVTGKVASISAPVSVGFAGNFTLATAINGTNYRQVRLNLGAMPAHTSIRVEWGDGTVNNYTTATATYAAPSATTYKTYYGSVDKTAKVRIFNGTKQIDEKSILIDLTP